MNSDNTWREQYADALDLPESPEYVEYDLNGETAHPQIMLIPGEGPIMINQGQGQGTFPFPWKSYLLNSWLLSGLICIVVTATVIIIASLQGKPQQTAQVDEVQANINKAATQLAQTRYEAAEIITRTDLNPTYANNPGLLQKAILTAGAEFGERVTGLQGDKTNTNAYGQHKAVISQNSKVEAMKLVSMGGAGQEIVISYEDPATGKITHQKLSSSETQALGIVKLLAIDASDRPTVQRSNLTEIALDVIGQQKAEKDALVEVLRTQGMGPVASQINNIDSYGRQLIPTPAAAAPVTTPAAPPIVQPLPTQSPLPKNPPAQKVSFNHVDPRGLTMP